MSAESEGSRQRAGPPHDAAAPVSRGRPPEAPPRLSVAHLLLLTACYAVYLSAVRSQAQGEPGVIGGLLACVFALGPATAWTGCAVLGWRRWRKARWPVEPGLWLMAVVGAQTAFGVAHGSLAQPVFSSPHAVSAALAACLLVLPALGRGLPAAWKAVFCLMAALYVAPLLVVSLNLIFGIGGAPAARLGPMLASGYSPVAVLLAAGLAGWELWHGTRRGWLHGLGLAVYAWTMSLPWLVGAVL
jgi:hypothetical protein